MSKIRTSDIRTALAESPSTAMELADLLKMTRRNVNVGIWVLQCTHQVHSLRSVPNPEIPARGRTTLKLYELTARGRAYQRMKMRAQEL